MQKRFCGTWGLEVCFTLAKAYKYRDKGKKENIEPKFLIQKLTKFRIYSTEISRLEQKYF